jgi:hypothetical protein
MTTKPETRYEFLGTGDELNYLSDMIRYFCRSDVITSKEAKKALERFEGLLEALAGRHSYPQHQLGTGEQRFSVGRLDDVVLDGCPSLWHNRHPVTGMWCNWLSSSFGEEQHASMVGT